MFVSDKSPFSDFQMTAFAHIAEEAPGCLFPSYKNTDPHLGFLSHDLIETYLYPKGSTSENHNMD